MHNNTHEFYRDLWQAISFEDDNFYSDSSRNFHSYKELKNNILKCCKTFEGDFQLKIAILCDKNFLNYCSILGVLFTENIWVPLSIKTPDERNLQILQNLDADILIIDNSTSEELVQKISDSNIKIISVSSLFAQDPEISYQPKLTNKPEDLAMVFYTSGSTGIPKGVMVKNEGFVNTIKNVIDIFKFKKSRFIDLHDLSFNLSYPILFPCILSKSHLFAANSDIDILFPGKAILREKINVLFTVPSTLKRIIPEKNSDEIINLLEYVVACGEPLTFELLETFLLINKNQIFYNFYGSTEVSAWNFVQKCTQSTLKYKSTMNFVPIGRPMIGNDAIIRNDGMLLVKGVQVTPGYIGHKSNSHLVEYRGADWFPMGDAGELIDGIYSCKGRIDGVLKVKGYRIHLSDIETNLKKIENINECVCFANHEKITAFVFSKKYKEPKSVLQKAREVLPSYMLPSKIIIDLDVPVNKNGKIDRAKIREKL